MKTKKIAAILVIMAVFAGSAFSQDYVLKFKIENNTGETLNAVYVTQADANHWGEDIIPGDVFTSGSYVDVTIPVENSTICMHDIKVTDFQNNSVIFENIDFCELRKLSFFLEDGDVKYIVE